MATSSLQSLTPARSDQGPANAFVSPLLTDMYQITMAYAYWKAERHEETAVFDLFFRKNPFEGEFTIFAGLEECIKYLQAYRFSAEQIAYLRLQLPDCEAPFWDYLQGIDGSMVNIFAAAEGTVVFPRVPLLRVEGPLAVCQLLESTLLNLCNYASLIATNAARIRLAAGREKTLLEFGLRRAQGPDGAMSASRYAFMGGFDGTSNVAAAMAHGITASGTHAHSLVSAFVTFDDLACRTLGGMDLVEAALRYRSELGFTIASTGELAAFIAFAQAFPDKFLALVDTYDTLSSGVPNFICVALCLVELGHTPAGIRLDSGDLAYLSKEARRMFRKADERYGTSLASCTIVASNDLNEAVILSLNDQGHEVDTFGVGTNLVTCQAQPALGMVYKLVEINGIPRIKLSQDASKVTIPGAKEAFRLIGSEGVPLLDILIRVGEARPQPGKRLLCRHPFDEKKRVYVTPSAVIPLLRLVWKGGNVPLRVVLSASPTAVSDGAGTIAPHIPPPAADDLQASEPAADGSAAEGSVGGSLRYRFPSLKELRAFVRAQLDLIREDHLRPLNPTPYKCSVSSELFHFIHDLWMKEVPIPELE